MIRRILTASALLLTATAASAEPFRLNRNTVIAQDGSGNAHTITVQYQDREGDVAISVYTQSKGTEDYWVRCSSDHIADRYSNGASGTWENVDHRNMAGWYADAACGRI